jgi:hypothetical protein
MTERGSVTAHDDYFRRSKTCAPYVGNVADRQRGTNSRGFLMGYKSGVLERNGSLRYGTIKKPINK